jgi:SAM-dependent methyltransferase
LHVQAHDFVARHARGLFPHSVLEIGSFDVNGGVRPLFSSARRYHGIDIAPGPGVDEVADAADWRTATLFDVVVSTEVLEHTSRWRDVVTNGWNALTPGGVLLMTCATDPRPPHSAIDGWEVRPGEWYANVAPEDAIALIRSFTPRAWLAEVALDRGDLYVRVDKADRSAR